MQERNISVFYKGKGYDCISGAEGGYAKATGEKLESPRMYVMSINAPDKMIELQPKGYDTWRTSTDHNRGGKSYFTRYARFLGRGKLIVIMDSRFVKKLGGYKANRFYQSKNPLTCVYVVNKKTNRLSGIIMPIVNSEKIYDVRP